MAKDKIEQFRAERRDVAEARGTTLEAELDEYEEFIHCKEYVDCLRLLLGVEIREG